MNVGNPEGAASNVTTLKFKAPTENDVVLTSRSLLLNQELFCITQLIPTANWWDASLVEALRLTPQQLASWKDKTILDLAGGGSMLADEAVAAFGAREVVVVDLNYPVYARLMPKEYPDPAVRGTGKMSNGQAALKIYTENMTKMGALIGNANPPWNPTGAGSLTWKKVLTDLRAKSSDIGKSYFATTSPKISRKAGNALDLAAAGLANDKFDLALNSWMMMYLDEAGRQKAIRELIRVTKPGGQIRIQGGNEEGAGGVLTGYKLEKYGPGSAAKTPSVSAGRFEIWFSGEKSPGFADPGSPDFKVYLIQCANTPVKCRVKINLDSVEALLVLDVLPPAPGAPISAPVTGRPAVSGGQFSWTLPKEAYRSKQIEASANKPIFLWQTSNNKGVLIKLFSRGEGYETYASPSRAGIIFQQRLLEYLGIPNDGPVTVAVSAEPGKIVAGTEVAIIKAKLKEIIGASLPQRYDSADEIWVLPLVDAAQPEFGFDTIGGLLQKFPAIPPALKAPLASVDLLKPELRINDQLKTLQAFLAYLADAAEMQKLGKLCVADALAGNEDRLLKSGDNLKLDNILLGSKAGQMQTVAIDNGGVCAYITTRKPEDLNFFDRSAAGTEDDKWVAATIKGYLDQMQGMACVDLDLLGSPDEAAKRLTLNLRRELVAGFGRLRALHEKLISADRNQFRADADLWTLQIAEAVNPIAAGAADKKGGTAPRDAGEFKYGREIKLDWLKVDKAISDGIKAAMTDIAAQSGADRMLDENVFNNSRIGKLAAEAKLKAGELSGTARASWDTIASRQLLLRIHYLDQRINKKKSAADARALLKSAVAKTARM